MNFTLPETEDIDRLIGLEKMASMTISVYGHDLESFIARSSDGGRLQAAPRIAFDNLVIVPEPRVGTLAAIALAVVCLMASRRLTPRARPT